MVRKKRIFWAPFLFAIAAVFVFWFASPFVLQYLCETLYGCLKCDLSVEDSFGALSSLFAGLAFVGVIFTLLQQQQQINAQAKDLQVQDRNLARERFEQTFFKLLDLFIRYIAGLVENGASNGNEPKRGRRQLDNILEKLAKLDNKISGKKLEVLNPIDRKANMQARIEGTAKHFRDRFASHSNHLSAYFRLLETILALVDKADVEDKEAYIGILRSQLSGSELQLIALNCARNEGAELRVFVERYGLLEHLPTELNKVDIHEICDEIRRLAAQEAKQV